MLLNILIVVVVLVVGIGGFVGWANQSGHLVNVNTLSVNKLTNDDINMSELEQVRLNVRTAKVTIEKSDTDSISLQNIVSKNFKISKDNSSINIRQKGSDKHQLEIGKSPVIVIRIKQGLNTVNIHQRNGTLRFNDVAVKDMKVTHVNGSTIADGLSVTHSGEITKKNGKTDLDNLTIPGLAVSVKNGTFKLNGTKKSNSYSDNKANQLSIVSGNGQVGINTK